MSSIFGICNKDNKPVSEADLQLMQAKLNHWNADGAHRWLAANTGLGHLMLWNTPESLTERLPLHDPAAALTITADARIDNRTEIYPLLRLNTTTQQQLPDSSLILELYKKYGVNCVQHLIGDFAFAIWDASQQQLFCARDQMGVKPFFYYNDSKYFAFASEKKGMLCLPGIDRSISKDFFYNQVLWPPVQAATTTIYNHIHRLAPATTLIVNLRKNTLVYNKYWTLDPYKIGDVIKKEDCYEALKHHFDIAVACRLRSAYNIGAELSGGLDSSAITGAAQSILSKSNKEIITFSNIYADEIAGKHIPGENEYAYAKAVVEFNRITKAVYISKDIWENPLDEVDFSLAVDDGIEMQSILWQLPIKHAATGLGVRTLLSGFPGDQMVTYRGQFHFLDYLDKKQYLRYFTAKPERKFIKIKPFLPSALEFAIHKLKNFSNKKSSLGSPADYIKVPGSYRMKKGDVVWQCPEYRERYTSYRHYQKYRLLEPSVALRMEMESRYGLYYKLESRFPMADIRLTQFFLSLPNDIKHGEHISRHTYRMAMKRYLPGIILEREGKNGNLAPFRMDAFSLEKRKEALQKILGDINARTRPHNVNYAHNDRYIGAGYLQLLRWYAENLEILED